MKLRLNYILPLLLSLVMVACSQKEMTNIDDCENDIKEFTFSVKDFKWETTRTTADITNAGITFKWASTDTIGVFPNTGSQVAFPIQTGADAANAIFNGGGWALKESSTYKAYLPYNRFMFDPAKIVLDYSGQYQDGNNNWDHVTKCDYLVSSLSTPESGKVNFEFSHIGCLVCFDLIVPNADSFYKMDFTVGYGITKTLNLDLSGDTYSVSAKESFASGTMSVRLYDCATTDDNKHVIVYCMLPAGSYGAATRIILYGAAHNYSHQINYSKTFESGNAYKYTDELAIDDSDPLNGYEYVDIDPTSDIVWATCNVGATTPEGFGDYFAWGELEPKTTFTKENYRFWDGTDYTKYFDSSSEVTLDLADDAARANMGGKWRMPTLEEIQTLKNCNGSWTTKSGVVGELYTNTYGAELFFPAAGYYLPIDDTEPYTSNVVAYSTSTVYPSSSYTNPCYLVGNQFGISYGSNGYGKLMGTPVRGVIDRKYITE